MVVRKPHGVDHGIGSAKKGDIILLLSLVVLLLAMGYARDGRLLNPVTGNIIEGYNEVWMSECSPDGASDTINELVYFYGCGDASGMCWLAANGVELKNSIIVNLDCSDSNSRQEWINNCDEFYGQICS